jgi:hypothetical protein
MMRLCLAAAVLLGGCTLYFSGDDDGECRLAADIAPNELRDPATGQCQTFDNFPCDDFCAPCAEAAQPQPDWGSCFSECEGLDEASCLTTPRCRAAYVNDSPTDGPPVFHQCWAIAPSGPATGACENLDAYECSRHDDCSGIYNLDPTTDGGLLFGACRPEAAGCFGNEDCGPGTHCSTSDGECLPPPGCTGDMACPAVCAGRCVPDQGSCAAVDCGPGTHCEEQCSSDGTCGPVCVPDDASCGPNTCPPGTECVQRCEAEDPTNPGCGICTIECVPSGMCETLKTEAECAGRADCAAVYSGESCTCDGNGACTCEILTYERCQPR